MTTGRINQVAIPSFHKSLAATTHWHRAKVSPPPAPLEVTAPGLTLTLSLLPGGHSLRMDSPTWPRATENKPESR